MKEFKCNKCGEYLGEMSNGKFKKNAVVLCNKCHDTYKTIYDFNTYEKNTKPKYDMPDFMKDIFKKEE